jgi:glutamate synthase (ferredoxin)
LRVDGGIRAGWEVVMAAILGADEYGFGSIAMIAEGCVMARVCHLNTCPVGVATQREDLRAKFKGTPENVVDFFFFLAQEVREVMAHLGYRSINELIGQTQLLKQKDNLNMEKSSSVDLSAVLKPEDVYTNLDWLEQREDRAHYNGYVLDDDLLFDDEF